ncbi:MAG: acetyl-CoA carboxylase biotin carboxyl carrier protein subunit, partial [Candidatus Bathyarchaeia archaeon]
EAKIPVESPLPGQVLKVNVKVGDKVEPGQPVVTLMSMKTEYNVECPQGGEVEQVTVQEGVEVDIGQVLLYLRNTA